MHTGSKTSDRDLGCHVIGHADEENVQRLVEQASNVTKASNSVLKYTVRTHLVTYRHQTQPVILIDDLSPAATNDPVAGDSDAQLVHSAVDPPIGQRG